MAMHAEHEVPVTTRSSVTTHIVALDDAEFRTVRDTLEWAVEGGGFPADHQIHRVLAALRP